MTVYVTDQALTPVTVDSTAYDGGDLLPAPSTAAEAAERAALRGGGLLRVVRVADSAEDGVAEVAALMAAEQAREAAGFGWDTGAGWPVLPSPGGTPLVVAVTPG